MLRRERVIVLFLLFWVPAAIGGCSSDEAAMSGGDYADPYGEQYPNNTGADASAGTTSDERYDEPAPPNPDDTDGEQYDAPGTNPFVATSHDPLSTFATDVDTASYDIFRRDIGYGALPNPDSVRLEEYINAFRYDYEAPPTDAVTPFAISMTAAPSPVSETILLAVGVRGREVPFERKPANLVFLIDTSGSMTSSDKLPLVQTVLTETLNILDPLDTVAIVTYAGSTEVRLEPTPISDSETIAAVINSLESGGSTAGAGGIQLAYEQAEAGFKEGGINHIVLCTDGDFNVGVSSTEGLVSLIEEKRLTGITLTVLGFGRGNLNDGMMEAVSNAGNGIYGVIANEDHAIDYVHNRMLSTIIHIAKDVKIQVEFNAATVDAYRLLGYENRALADDQFRDDSVDAGEIGSGHTVTALFELVLTGDPVPSPDGAPEMLDGAPTEEEVGVFHDELCRVRIRYKGVNSDEEDEAFETQQGLSPGEMQSSFADTDSDFQWAAAIAAFAEILKGSPFAHPEAIETIQLIVDSQAGTAADRLEFIGLLQTARTLLPN